MGATVGEQDIPPHPTLGSATTSWHYRNSDGSIFCSVARWDYGDRRKEIRQFHVNGSGAEWARPKGQAPLFAVGRIANIGRVLVVAGEKAADAAQRLFPGWAVTTSLGGESAAARTDWSPVRDKLVTIWPDADEPGRKYADAVGKLCLQAGARNVHIVNIPLDAPAGWDLADEPPQGWDLPMMVDNADSFWSDIAVPLDQPCAAVPALFDHAPTIIEPPPILPAAVWEAKPWLAELRQYAAAREFDSDLLLGAVLARLSAVVPKGTTMDTGIMSARASLNLMVAGIGGTGSGKSQALSASAHVVQAVCGPDGWAEGQIGSGEGIAEAFIGSVCDDPSLPKKEQRIEKRQIRHNAFLFLDEGEALHKLSAQRSNTTMPTIRSAAVGAPLGAMNASAETKRHVTNYHLGVYIGYQPCTVGPLLSEVAEGTPQRFLFCMAGRPLDIPDAPGYALPVIELQDRPGLVVGFSSAIRSEIRGEHRRRRSLPPNTEPDWLSHATLLRCKVAALLCLVDQTTRDSYTTVAVDDNQWRLAGMICETSSGIVRWLVSHIKERIAEIEIERITARAAGAQTSQIAIQQAPVVAESVARGIALRVHDTGRATKGDVRRKLRGDRRHLFGVSCDIAEARGWVIIEEKHLSPGGCRPS